MSVPTGDFYCWSIPPAQIDIATTPVALLDQFHEYENIIQFEALQFCDNADKDLPDPQGAFSFDPPDFLSPFMSQHYTTYKILDGFDPDERVDIGVGNFGIVLPDTPIGPVVELWVPNIKSRPSSPAGGTLSDNFDFHYVCYDLDEPSIDKLIQMRTQFGITQIKVLDPILLCNPVKKTHDGIFNSDALLTREHLTCFNILIDNTGDPPSPNPAVPDVVAVFDQLIEDNSPTDFKPVSGLTDHKACFESTKQLLDVAGTFVPIDSSLLLLAGAQMIGAWIVPAIVAGAGIAIVISRKY